MPPALHSHRPTAIERGRMWAAYERRGGRQVAFAYRMLWYVVGGGLGVVWGLVLTVRGEDWGPELVAIGVALLGWAVHLLWGEARQGRLVRRMRRALDERAERRVRRRAARRAKRPPRGSAG